MPGPYLKEMGDKYIPVCLTGEVFIISVIVSALSVADTLVFGCIVWVRTAVRWC